MNKREDFLPFCRHQLGKEEEQAVLEVLQSAWITTGPVTDAFEREFAARVGTPHAVAASSCTGGLFMVCQALGIGPGDEVVVPALTWPATANAPVMLGAKVVFADVDYKTLCVTRESIEPCLNDDTKAVAIVHFAGLSCELDSITGLCRERGIMLIEDSAHALGSKYNGRHVGGQYAVASVYSFHPIKNITTGEGGMITCHDAALYEKLSLCKFHGISRDAWKAYKGGGIPLYDLEWPALKFNFTDLQAAIGRVQLGRLDAFNERRRQIARCYLSELAGVSGLDLPADSDGHAWHLFVVKLNKQAQIQRDGFICRMRELNVGIGIHFLPVNELTFYKKQNPLVTPHAEKAGRTCVSLPLYPMMQDRDVCYVVDCIKHILGGQ